MEFFYYWLHDVYGTIDISVGGDWLVRTTFDRADLCIICGAIIFLIAWILYRRSMKRNGKHSHIDKRIRREDIAWRK